MSALPTEQRLGLLAWAALTALQLVWHGWLLPPQAIPTWLVLAITVIPLLLPLLAIRNPRRALLWVGILSLFYRNKTVLYHFNKRQFMPFPASMRIS